MGVGAGAVEDLGVMGTDDAVPTVADETAGPVRSLAGEPFEGDGVSGQQSHARSRAGRVERVCAAGEHRQLLRGVRTFVKDISPGFFGNPPWVPGHNPKTAVHAYLEQHQKFEIDRGMYDKLQVGVAPDVFLNMNIKPIFLILRMTHARDASCPILCGS